MALSNKARGTMAILGCVLILLTTQGLAVASLSLYMTPLSESLGVSLVAVANIPTFMGISSIFVAGATGKIIAKIKFHNAVTLGGICHAIGFLLISRAVNITMAWLGGAFIGGGLILCGLPISQTAITTWFVKGRGTLSGVVGLTEAVGTAIFIFRITEIINASPLGYQTSAVYTAVICFAVSALAGQLLMRNKPETYGLTAVGAEEIEQSASEAGEIPGISEKEAMRSKAFWVMLIATGIVATVQFALTPQQAVILTNYGCAPVQIATLLSVCATSKVLNKLLFGVITDNWGLRIGIIYSTIAFIIAVVIMLVVHNNYVGVLTYEIGLGMGIGLAGNYPALVVAKMFGRKDIQKLAPVPSTFSSLGVALGPILFSILYTLGNGNFQIVFGGCLVLLIVFLVLITSVVKPYNFFEEEASFKTWLEKKKSRSQVLS